jgi:alcohol dehydrogenase, propanol-preferring
MRAAVLDSIDRPLAIRDVPPPRLGPGQVLIRVSACGVCRTDLHIVDGELKDMKLPLVPGHQIVGVVEECGPGGTGVEVGSRVGVPWLGFACGACAYCLSGRENLCDSARFTGYHIDGGFAEQAVADARFCFPLPAGYPDVQAAPLLCAGLIGYRALRMAGNAEKIGFYGFGSAAHILVQAALFQGRKVYAFTRPGDESAKAFARKLGVHWAGDSTVAPPQPLEAAIIFAPDGALLPRALAAVAKGGTVICAGIHMSDIPAFPYALLWGERAVRSVANLTRRDAEEFLALAPLVPIRTEVEVFPLARVNEALARLRGGDLNGSLVIAP